MNTLIHNVQLKQEFKRRKKWEEFNGRSNNYTECT